MNQKTTKQSRGIQKHNTNIIANYLADNLIQLDQNNLRSQFKNKTNIFYPNPVMVIFDKEKIIIYFTRTRQTQQPVLMENIKRPCSCLPKQTRII